MIDYHPLARKEFRNAIKWYRQRSKRAAVRFVEAFFEAQERIAANPYQWPIYVGNSRWVMLRRFPYVLYYKILASGDVKIMAVAHAKRRPRYWLRRQP